mmetsp:Transcript_145787/g.254532  ORF Transcript_145787/g.254532 Transcript_145787/m.254532 type:complete len:852 (-) Transcript_145787:1496-4051(-)
MTGALNNTLTVCGNSEVFIPDGSKCCMGTILPIFGDAEQQWPSALRGVLYFVGLVWMFLGVAIVADIFMAAIEQITSKETVVYMDVHGKKRRFHVKVWNYTVANLTLMALGSSAPEILLSVFEILSGEFFTGKLGPSTIVGSAAFNLLIISPVCIMAIPSPEIRYIRCTGVYSVTAFASVAAYLWLLLVLLGTSPNEVTIGEAVTTLLFFPVLVLTAYAFDVGIHRKMMRKVLSAHMDEPEEIPKARSEFVAEQMRLIRESNPEASTEDLSNRLKVELAKREPKTRAFHRLKAARHIQGERKRRQSQVDPQVKAAMEVTKNPDQKEQDKSVTTVQVQDVNSDISDGNFCMVGFASSRYCCSEGDGMIVLNVKRTGVTNVPLSLSYQTKDGTAKHTAKYHTTSGQLKFAAHEETKQIEVEIVDNDTYDGDVDFVVELAQPECSVSVLLGISKATITIFDDDDPGVLRWSQDTYICSESDGKVALTIEREQGSGARVSCSYTCEQGSAVAGKDYEHVEGEIEFSPGQVEYQLEIPILNDEAYEKDEYFKVVLSDPQGGVKFDSLTDGGEEKCIAVVQIFSDDNVKNNVDKILSLVDKDKLDTHVASWKDQFIEAFWCNGSREDQKEASWGEYILHLISLPFKLIFATCAPVGIWGGWACFIMAICYIGVLTALIGDLASLLGCSIGLDDLITAMTLVAIGTSLPDTFASKTAANDDPFADASIGNITGSNSVNVFLGLGTPWVIATIYWLTVDRNGEAAAKWRTTYGPTSEFANLNYATQCPDLCFAVPAGNLAYTVLIFSVCALLCLTMLALRRWKFGGELGGPFVPKVATSCFSLSLWLLFIALAIIDVYK